MRNSLSGQIRLGNKLKGVSQKETFYPNESTTFGGYKTDRAFADECVALFLAAGDSLLVQSRGDASGHDGIDSEKAIQQARRAWSGFSRARLFMIKPDRWASLYRAADRFCEESTGNVWEEYDPKKEVLPEAAEKLWDFYATEGPKWPFPDPLPFDSVFFCYGGKLTIRGSALSSRIRDPRLAEMNVRLIGNLLFWEGDRAYAYTLVLIDELDGDMNVGVLTCYADDEWFQPASLDPWILNSLVHSVNEHKSIVQDYAMTLANRLDRKKASKKAKAQLPLPAPFYMINLKDELITPQQAGRAKAPGPGKLVDWAYRWDQRAHECVRFMKGPMPIDSKLAVKLAKRGYRIYEGRPMSAEDASRIMKRGQRGAGPDEWIAVLSYWQEACVKGPKDKPYIPGARI